MQKITSSTIEFSKLYPEAFAALPEAYQNDDVLEYTPEFGGILAQAKEDQVSAIGNEVYYYHPPACRWTVAKGRKRF